MEQSDYEGGYEDSNGAGNGREDNNAEEELNYIKGKGKSGGKGFRGNCYHCGQYGHRLNQCRIKDMEMQAKYTRQKGDCKIGPGKGVPSWTSTLEF